MTDKEKQYHPCPIHGYVPLSKLCTCKQQEQASINYHSTNTGHCPGCCDSCTDSSHICDKEKTKQYEIWYDNDGYPRARFLTNEEMDKEKTPPEQTDWEEEFDKVWFDRKFRDTHGIIISPELYSAIKFLLKSELEELKKCE